MNVKDVENGRKRVFTRFLVHLTVHITYYDHVGDM